MVENEINDGEGNGNGKPNEGETTNNTRSAEANNTTLPRLVFPYKDSKTYFRKPVFYWEVDVNSTDAPTITIKNGHNEIEVSWQNSVPEKITVGDKHYIRKQLENALEPGSYIIKQGDEEIALEIVHFLYPLADMTLYEKKPKFFFDKEARDKYWTKQPDGKCLSPYKIQNGNSHVALICPHDDAYYLEPASDLEPTKYELFHNQNPVFEVTIECLANEEKIESNLRQYFSGFVRDLANNRQSFSNATYLWDDRLEENNAIQSFWDIEGTPAYQDQQLLKSKTTESAYSLFFGSTGLKLKAEHSNVIWGARFTPGKPRSGTFQQETPDLAILKITSQWLSGNLPNYMFEGIYLHYHRPMLFPLPGKHVYTATKFGLEVKLGPNVTKDTLPNYQAIREHCERLIKEDSSFIKETVETLTQNKNWHFDWMTEFVRYIDNPMLRGTDFLNMLRVNPQIIVYGPPGTGKTHNVKLDCEWVVEWEKNKRGSTGANISGNEFIELIQFHPGYGYEDLIEGLKPYSTTEGQLSYKVEPGSFKKFCEKAGAIEWALYRAANSAKIELKEPWGGLGYSIEEDNGIKFIVKRPKYKQDEPDSVEIEKNTNPEITIKNIQAKLPELNLPSFFFIIDEINRASLSNALGELMYCLEYRGPSHALNLTLSSLSDKTDEADKKFFIPSNVRLIGTMNTIDRSIEPIDFAMSRRFGWEKRNCDYEVMTRVLRNSFNGLGLAIDEKIYPHLKTTLEKLNNRLHSDLSRMGEDFQIGETYLYKLPRILNTKVKAPANQIYANSEEYKAALAELYLLYLAPILEDYYAGERKWNSAKKEFEESFSAEKVKLLKNWNQVKQSLETNPQVIIYGPPGTGKTHCLTEQRDFSEFPKERVTLIQFHPRYTYQDFLQGIRPVQITKQIQGNKVETIEYQVKAGTLKNWCAKAGKFERALYTLMSHMKEKNGYLSIDDWLSTACSKALTRYGFNCIRLNDDKHLYFYSFDPPGNPVQFIKIGHTNLEVKIYGISKSFSLNRHADPKKKIIDWITENCPVDKYLLIIDEINRAELAEVFGELMYCLEYRGPNGAIPLSVSNEKDPFVLDRSNKEHFFIPTNLYIVGAMNTIDRSTERIDFALRRRFAWLKFEPSNIEEFIDAMFSEKVENNPLRKTLLDAFENESKAKNQVQELFGIFENVNKQLKNDLKNLGPDFAIGETYFYKAVHILRTVKQDTDKKATSFTKRIDNGAFWGKTITQIMFDNFLEPVLSDYYRLAGLKWDESRRNKYKDLMKAQVSNSNEENSED